jgi:uncharacterized protein with GYD domain
MYLSLHNVTNIKRSSRRVKANKKLCVDAGYKVTEIVITDENDINYRITLYHSNKKESK